MKHLCLSILFFMAAGPILAQSPDKIVSISFTRQSRGFVDEVRISPDSVRGFVEDHRNPGESKRYAAAVASNQWMSLIRTLDGVSMDEIDGLQSPTMNRAHDGAMHSSIVITFEDGTTVTHSFDNENPHPDLQPLLKAILEFRMPTMR